MSRIAWFKIGAVAALWTIVAAAAVAGWLIGKGGAERQIAELRQRLAPGAAPGQSCKLELELVEARAQAAPAPNPFGVTLAGLVLTAPRHLHLREMLTSR